MWCPRLKILVSVLSMVWNDPADVLVKVYLPLLNPRAYFCMGSRSREHVPHGENVRLSACNTHFSVEGVKICIVTNPPLSISLSVLAFYPECWGSSTITWFLWFSQKVLECKLLRRLQFFLLIKIIDMASKEFCWWIDEWPPLLKHPQCVHSHRCGTAGQRQPYPPSLAPLSLAI